MSKHKSAILSKELQCDVELSTKGQAIRPLKKRSSKQKEREKKKFIKLMDKKAKQSKMLDILSSLQSHKDDLT